MKRAPGIRILAILGLLTATGVGSSGSATAQTPAGQTINWQTPTLRPAVAPVPGDNQLQIVAARSLPSAYNPAGPLRVVQDTEPRQPEPIGRGAPQGNDSTLPPSAAAPPGNYEAIDTGWKPIGAVTASIAPPVGELPANLAAAKFAQAGEVVAPVNENRDWPTLSYSWEASAVAHNPLYFEDVNLERYGYTRGFLQPLISGGRFFTTVVFLPYKIVAHPPGELIYPLGYARPGDPAQRLREIEPIKLSAATVEAAFVVGMVILLP